MKQIRFIKPRLLLATLLVLITTTGAWADNNEANSGVGDWIYYDNGKQHAFFTDFVDFPKWGIKIPSTDLVGNKLTMVSFYIEPEYNTKPITIEIYSDGDDEPGNKIYSEKVSLQTSEGFQMVTLKNPVTFDESKSLWVILTEEGQNLQGSISNIKGRKDVHSYYYDYEKSEWTLLRSNPFSKSEFMIRAYVEPASLYEMTTETNEHGTLEYSVNGKEVTKACEGQEVVVTVNAETGWQPYDMTVEVTADWSMASARSMAPANGIPVVTSVTPKKVEGTTNQWSFTMPAGNVSLSVTYQKLLWNSDIKIAVEQANYTGSPLMPKVTVTDNGTELKEGTDYTITGYTNNVEMAQATDGEKAPTVTISAVATSTKYAGDTTVTFTISKAVEAVTFAVATVQKDYFSAPFTQAAIFKGDGTVSYSSSNRLVAEVDAKMGLVRIWNTGRATITAKVTDKEGGNYTYSPNTASYELVVTTARMSVTAKAYEGTYDGKPHTISMKAPTGAKVVYGTAAGKYDLDEAPTFTEAGTYTVYYKVTKKHYTTVTSSKKVTIKPAAITEVTLKSESLVYTGGELKAEVASVKAGNLTLTADDYDVEGNVQTEMGEYSLTVKGKGNFTGELSATFEIKESPIYSETKAAVEQLKEDMETIATEAEQLEMTDAARETVLQEMESISQLIDALEQQLEKDRTEATNDSHKADYDSQIEKIGKTIADFASRINGFPIMGDSNNDNMVDIDDYVALGQMILGLRPMATGDTFLALDLNGDKSLGVGDLTGELNLWMGRSWDNSGSEARQQEAPVGRNDNMGALVAGNTLTIDDITICQGETKEVTIIMNTRQTAYGAQMDLTLPEGLEVEEGSLKAAANRRGMQATQARVDGNWRFGFARQGREIGSYGALATFMLTADEELTAGEYVIDLSKIKVNVGGSSSEMMSGQVKVTVTEVPPLDEVRFSAVETAMTVNPGMEYDVQVTLHNSAPTMNRITSFSGTIEMPDGMSIVGGPYTSDRIPAGAELELNAANNKFMLWPADGAYVSGTDGTVFTFTVMGTKKMATYDEIKLTNLKVADAKANEAALPDVEISVVLEIPDVALTAPTAKTLTYNGEAQELITAGTAEGGEMLYSLDGENYSTEIPVGTEAGDYTVYYKVEADDNHNGTEPESLSVTIGKADITLKAPVAQTALVYSGEAQELITAGTAEGGEMQYSTDGETYTTEIPVGTNAGDYKIYYKVVADANHNDSGEADSLVVTIGKADVTLTLPKAQMLTYNGEAQKLITAGTAEGGEMQYSTDGETYATEVPVGTEAGSYTIYYQVIADANHNGADADSLVVAIAPKGTETLTVTVGESADYEVPAITVKDGDKTLTETGDYTLSYKDLQGKTVTKSQMEAAPGDYIAVVTLTGNYSGTVEQPFTVTLPVGIRTTIATDADAWYTLGGRRLPGKPTKKGLYIHQGRNVKI